jgi:CheY-like chemotaxis protein
MAEKKPKVVVIDDSEASITLYKRSAERLQVDLKVFQSPAESLQYLESHPADLVFTDLIMRKADGWDVLKKLKGWDRHKDTPIVVVTSKNYAQDQALAIELGAKEFLIKPLRSQEIREIICNYTDAEPFPDPVKEN